MRLHEEYIQRHKLKVPVIQYSERTTVFLRSSDTPSQWKIMWLHWKNLGSHPGYYEVVFGEPNRPSGFNFSFVKNLISANNCYWEDYETRVLSLVALAKSNKLKAITSEEKIFAAWSIFLSMYKIQLTKKMSESFFWLIEQSFRTDIEYNLRLTALRMAKRMLPTDDGIENFLTNQLMTLVHDDSDWLVKLINE